MKPYTESEPVFSESIQVTEPTDPAHADNINAGPKQLLQNTLVNKKEIEDLKQGNNEVEFDDTVIPGEGEGPGEVPDPAEALEQITSGKSVPALIGHIKRTLTGLLPLSQRALNIAMGKSRAWVFATVEDLDAWLAVPANVKQLNIGDNFYITAVDVPDYWWDGTQKQKLETQKVDLTTYDQRISQLNENISSHNHDGRYLPPVWNNYDVTIYTNNFQGSIYVYKRNGGYKQILIQGSLLANLAADTGGRYIGNIPDGAKPDVHLIFPGITKKGKNIWIHIIENGEIYIENYSLNAAVLEKNDHFEIANVYY